ncbi:MAG: hypothetical protein GXY33_21505 [Phycisphaerae bacterium]|nr:hypothetical protein [Phycisphaerae bacterium]
MNGIAGRIGRAEKALGLDESRTIMVIVFQAHEPSPEERRLPEDTRDWLTYREQMAGPSCGPLRIVILKSWEEVQARQRLQKETVRKGDGRGGLGRTRTPRRWGSTGPDCKSPWPR